MVEPLWTSSSANTSPLAHSTTAQPAVAVKSLADGLLLNRVLQESGSEGGASTGKPNPKDYSQLNEFFEAKGVVEKLRLWLGDDFLRRHGKSPWREVALRLQQDISLIDGMLCQQSAKILHHPQFLQLEAGWRGLAHLADCKERAGEAPIRIRVLNATWSELRRDFDRASDFDQSQLFQLVYDNEFGMPGGLPFGALLADYDVHPRPSPKHPHDDIAVLKSLSQVAAAAFCPVFLNASPSMFGVDRFDQMQHSIDYGKVQSDLDFLAWRQFRETEDSRFVGLAMPRMLMRRPYGSQQIARSGYLFDEMDTDRDAHVWGGAVYAVGETLIRAFGQSRWLADIRGVQRGIEGGGLVLGPVSHEFTTDSPEIAAKPITDLVVSDALERQLAELGFISLCACKDTPFAGFFSSPSAQKPQRYNTADATANAKMSAMLNYILCVSRFSHFIKIIGREKIGSFKEPEELQRELHNWLMEYVVSNADASLSIKAARPLRAAQVNVRAHPDKPGSYSCTMLLSPHYELDDMQASIRLVAELAPARV